MGIPAWRPMEAVVREKGRVTLPLALRKRLGLRTGDRVIFELERGKFVLKLPNEVKVDDVYGIVKGLRVRLEDIDDAPPE